LKETGQKQIERISGWVRDPTGRRGSDEITAIAATICPAETGRKGVQVNGK